MISICEAQKRLAQPVSKYWQHVRKWKNNRDEEDNQRGRGSGGEIPWNDAMRTAYEELGSQAG